MEQLLQALPEHSGMAFVVVQHLAPTFTSMLSAILQRFTKMPVIEVGDEPEVRADHVYVIPPNRNMIITDGHLRLLPRSEARGQHRPIDWFFRSLAEFASHQGIGVVLSGTGNDGTLGLMAIKAEGGITFAQDESAQQEGMPRSAIAAGCVDFIMSPAQIAQELVRIGHHPYVTPEKPGPPDAHRPIDFDKDLDVILKLVHDVTGIDFSNYKSTTLLRRITRRMLLQKLESMPEYLAFLQNNPTEVQNLYRDILISVTSFFRDEDAVEVLKKKVFPKLIKEHSPQDPIRIWVMGCSTGEEAYSLAMAVAEVIVENKAQIPAQIFATDLNEQGIIKARAGFYAKSIAQDISPERLRRFFEEADGGYRVAKSIREMCIFARQNVLSDPPFSRMDLITCRNLLIYLEPVLQQKIIPLLHYALKPHGLYLAGQFGNDRRFRRPFRRGRCQAQNLCQETVAIIPTRAVAINRAGLATHCHEPLAAPIW